MDNSANIIGIIGAMDEEIEALVARTDIIKLEKTADMFFCSGTLGGKRVVIVKCGMGKVNAGICTQLLISRYNATHIINTGFAGALSPAVSVGDIVVSKDFVQHDFDVSPIGFKKGEIPFTGLTAFPADEQLVDAAMQLITRAMPDVRVTAGRICSGDSFISDNAAKERIYTEYGGLCCDMESAAAAQVCYLNSVPFIALRAVSDSADDSAGVEFNFSVFQKKIAEIFTSATIELIETAFD